MKGNARAEIALRELAVGRIFYFVYYKKQRRQVPVK